MQELQTQYQVLFFGASPALHWLCLVKLIQQAADLNRHTSSQQRDSRKSTKRNRKSQCGARKSHNRWTTAEFTAKLPKIIPMCRSANPHSSRDCVLSLLAAGILPVSISTMTRTPDSSHIRGGPEISTSDSGRDTQKVASGPPELSRSRRVVSAGLLIVSNSRHSWTSG